MDEERKALHKFWFGEIQHGFTVENRSKIWFGSDPSFDDDVRGRFSGLLARAEDGELSHWQETPRGRLSLILLFDQMGRNIFRGEARAFANDQRARQLCRDGIKLGHDKQLSFVECQFFYMPLMHSERLADQQLCLTLLQAMLPMVPDNKRSHITSSIEFAKEHLALIEQFGRFPHRNALLGRESTPEEQALMADGGKTYGQG